MGNITSSSAIPTNVSITNNLSAAGDTDKDLAYSGTIKSYIDGHVATAIANLITAFETDGTGSGTRTSNGKITTIGSGSDAIIIKTFNATSSIDNVESFTFPTAFPNNCFAVTYGGMSGSTTNLTTSGFDFNRLNDFGGVFTSTVIAIGN